MEKLMDSNEETVQKRVVVDRPYQRSEVVTERTERGPRESGLSVGMIAIIAILAITAMAAILYIVSNRNANESANRNANLEVASQAQQPATIVQRPAQQAPVIIQQPTLRDNASDDANMQEVATKRLGEETDMKTVSITITDSQAVLTGTVYSAAIKAKAEQIVKAVRGVKSVDNKIVVSGE